MKILFTGKNHSQGLKVQDPTTLAGVAEAIGFQLVTSISHKPDFVICVDYERSALSLIREARQRGIKTVLVTNEPAVVIPQHSQVRIRQRFDKVLEVGRPWAEPALRWPQTWLPISENEDRLNRAVMINADKWSFVRGQQYWLRSAAATQINSVDVYGFGWAESIPVRVGHRAYELMKTIVAGSLPSFRGLTKILGFPGTYLGPVTDKYIAMSNYKVALVIENSKEFLTEKLFDAWFAGCIPVYLGPPIEAFGLPSDLAFQVKQPTLDEVSRQIDLALSTEFKGFSDKVQGFLSSDSSNNWRASRALERILVAATQ